MRLLLIVFAFLIPGLAQPPGMQVEWLASSVRITNTSGSMLTAFFVGLKNVSSGPTEWTSQFQDSLSSVTATPPLRTGEVKEVPMHSDAPADDTRVAAALFADGSSEGDGDAVDFLVRLRKSTAAAIPAVVEKMESLAAGGATKQDIVAALRKTSNRRTGPTPGSGLPDPNPVGEITASLGAAKLLAERSQTYDVYALIPVLRDWQHRLEQAIPAGK